MSIGFKECASCAAKPGSPTLCESCLHNRNAISRLQSDVERHENVAKALAGSHAQVREERDAYRDAIVYMCDSVLGGLDEWRDKAIRVFTELKHQVGG